MTDKEKLNAIRAEVQNYIDAAHKAHTNITEGNFAHLLSFIDSLQEESVSIDFEQELYKAFGQVQDFTLGMRIAKWFYAMGKNSQEPVSEDLEDSCELVAD